MCTGLEILTAVGAGLSGASALKSLGAKTPQAVQQNPLADAAAADTKAAQDAAEKKLNQRRAARANSLLSAAGAAGDLDPAVVAAGGAKTSLGA